MSFGISPNLSFCRPIGRSLHFPTLAQVRRLVVRLGLAGSLLLLSGSCTALRVVTHTTDANPLEAPAGRYQLDPHHWSLAFDIDHLHYARFVMRFDRVSASLDLAPEHPDESQVHAVIETASVDTNDPELDRQVGGPEMLDIGRYPDIRFDSTNLKRTGDNRGEMVGNLTIHGQSRPVTLAVTFNGGAPNPLTRAHTLGFAATGSFDRSSFGLGTWFPAVGDQINVSIQAEFVKEG
ncbi:YceI family protein [Telmatospirillum sp.]|uniref:YceI family protein n=1 Tax=Telmatospirillum sp. TaxID=2079197 RepID=UPI00283BFB1E|nr:YceI family protein [Telmatospirillum sp.]MDR3435375.1 YceI family protein [Telmatospirillum sp.]